jgi:hypothetical protein
VSCEGARNNGFFIGACRTARYTVRAGDLNWFMKHRGPPKISDERFARIGTTRLALVASYVEIFPIDYQSGVVPLSTKLLFSSTFSPPPLEIGRQNFRRFRTICLPIHCKLAVSELGRY